ncbi:cell wall hydrolase [uncultured Enterovirga sp.]|uniref:cell wall hydrolase n=1 Tax=uncultured Enterovirga sp. TaxID=2026352 RepID=UPI0035CBAF06
MGAAVQGFGTTIGGMVADAYREDKKTRGGLEAARAEADLTTRMYALNARREEETDPDKLAGYEAAQRQLVDESARNFSDPDKAELWRTQKSPTIASQKVSADARANRLRTDSSLAADDARLDALQREVPRAKTPEELGQLVKSGNQIITAQAEAGHINERAAGEKKRALAVGFARRFALSKSPEERLQLLGPDEDEQPTTAATPGNGAAITYTERDLDRAARTIIGEARGQPRDGKAAVAHVIRNRVVAGGYGADPTSVVQAPHQFEPWSRRRAELEAIDSNSPDFQEAHALAKAAFDGTEADPTKGATHFANVGTVAERGDSAGRPGGWLTKMTNVTKIGAHTFGNADAGRNPNYVRAAAAPTQISPQVQVAGAAAVGDGPTPPAAPMIYADSLGVGLASAAGFAPADGAAGKRQGTAPGFQQESAQPAAVYSRILLAPKAAVPGQQLVISAVSNDPTSGLQGLPAALHNAKEKGYKPVVMGVGTKFGPEVNEKIKTATEAAGGVFVPLPTEKGMVGADGVHLTDAGSKKVWADIQAVGGGASLGAVPGAPAVPAPGTGAPPPSPLHPVAQVLSFEDRRAIRMGAREDIAKRGREEEKTRVGERAQMVTLLNDDLASVERTGQGIPDLNRERVQKALGDEGASHWLSERARAHGIYEALDGIDTLSEGDIEQRLRKLEPRPGTVGYVDETKTYERARKQADKHIQARRVDPALAVDNFPTVKAARTEAKYTQIGEAKVIEPASAQRIVSARIAAQQQIGITEPMAVTKSQAREIARQLRSGENDDDKLKGFVGSLHATYGEDLTDQILTSTFQHVGVNTDLAVASTDALKSVAAGQRPTVGQARRVETLRDNQTATDAMSGRESAALPDFSFDPMGNSTGMGSPATPQRPRAASAVQPEGKEKPPVLRGSVTGEHLRMLHEGRDNPETKRAFNDVYGTPESPDPAAYIIREADRRKKALADGGKK